MGLRFDFAIVGGGIAGASLAARLAPACRVLLLEQEDFPGYHSTGRSAALYTTLYGNDVVRALTRAGRGFLDAPPAGFAATPLLTPRGLLLVSREADAFERNALPSSTARLLDGEEARRLVSVLRPDACRGALYEPHASDVDVHALHQGFLRMARAHGAQITCAARVTGIEHAASGWKLATAAGEFEAGTLVNAAGAWADALASMAQVAPLGLQPLLRTAITIDAPAGVDTRAWPCVLAADESYYFKPEAGLLLASPADETPSPPCDAQPDELGIAECVDRIERATDIVVQRVRRSWAGLRTFAPDRTPVVGYDPRVPDFFWLAGLGGYGVQLSPALSELAAAMALRKAPPSALLDEGVDPEALRPDRLG